jgi:hypothetical protein
MRSLAPVRLLATNRGTTPRLHRSARKPARVRGVGPWPAFQRSVLESAQTGPVRGEKNLAFDSGLASAMSEIMEPSASPDPGSAH